MKDSFKIYFQEMEKLLPIEGLFEILTQNGFHYNLGQNICRLFLFLAQFFFTTIETELDYYHQKVSARVASRVAERLKTFPEISRRSLKCLDLIASTQPSNQKPNFDIFW